MTAPATTTISFRIPVQQKEKANRIIRGQGYTPNQVLQDVYRHIAETGEVPRYDDAQESREREDALERIKQLTRHVRRGSAIARMSDEELREARRNRDL